MTTTKEDLLDTIVCNQANQILLENKGITGEMIPYIMDWIIKKHKNAVTLYLDNNPLGDTGAESLVAALIDNNNQKTLPDLKRINVQNCQMGLAGITTLYGKLWNVYPDLALATNGTNIDAATMAALEMQYNPKFPKPEHNSPRPY